VPESQPTPVPEPTQPSYTVRVGAEAPEIQACCNVPAERAASISATVTGAANTEAEADKPATNNGNLFHFHDRSLIKIGVRNPPP